MARKGPKIGPKRAILGVWTPAISGDSLIRAREKVYTSTSHTPGAQIPLFRGFWTPKLEVVQLRSNGFGGMEVLKKGSKQGI